MAGVAYFVPAIRSIMAVVFDVSYHLDQPYNVSQLVLVSVYPLSSCFMRMMEDVYAYVTGVEHERTLLYLHGASRKQSLSS